MQGSNRIIGEAVSIGKNNASILVYGSVSDPMAMPNYVPPKQGAPAGDKTPQLATYDVGNVHVVRASALGVEDIVGDFEKELLTVGQAIIHDKIVVVDPLSEDGFVAMGSHNLGYKASYQNDENLLCAIVRGEFNISGLQNKTLRRHLSELTSNQVSRLLKRLRTHGLVKKVGHTYKYYVTAFGKQVVATALKLRDLVIIPQLALELTH